MNTVGQALMNGSSTVIAQTPRMAKLGPAGAACTALAFVSCGGWWLWLQMLGQPTAIDGVICALPLLVTAALAFTSQADRQQYIARTLAATLMLPILLMMWATSQDLSASTAVMGWSIAGLVLLHAAGFVGLILHLATTTTRIERQDGATLGAELLAGRLRTLMAASADWSLARGEHPHQWVLDSRQPNAEERFHRVLIDIREDDAEVLVRERLGVNGAAPNDDDEASMRNPGDAWETLSPPDAQRVWSRTFQATMIDPAALAAVRLHMMGGHAQAEPAAMAQAVESKAMLTLLAALVTRSGYAWQPVLMRRG